MTADKVNGVTNQTKTILGSSLEVADQRTLDLLGHYWPPVHIADGLSTKLSCFMQLADIDRSNYLSELRGDAKRYGEFIHVTLAEIYSYFFGYQDGVATQNLDDDLEIKLLKVKIQIEREFLQFWVGKIETPLFSDQYEAANYLDQIASSNPGVLHPLFKYLEHEAPLAQVELF